MVHQGADVVVLEDAGPFEAVLARDLTADGVLVRVANGRLSVSRAGAEPETRSLGDAETVDTAVLGILEPMLAELLRKYDPA